MAKTVNLTIRLDEDLKQGAMAASNYSGLSLTKFIELMLHAFIEQARLAKKRKASLLHSVSVSKVLRADSFQECDKFADIPEICVLDFIGLMHDENRISPQTWKIIYAHFYRRFADRILRIPSEIPDEVRFEYLERAVAAGSIDSEMADSIRENLSFSCTQAVTAINENADA